MISLGLGTALAGIAGGLIAPINGMNTDMGTNVVWTVLLMCMLGGMDSLLGALAGGLVIGQVLSFGQYYLQVYLGNGALVQILLFIIIGVVLYFKPNGLLGRGVDVGV
jgi:branched-chain amino acid transport system permease protein